MATFLLQPNCSKIYIPPNTHSYIFTLFCPKGYIKKNLSYPISVVGLNSSYRARATFMCFSSKQRI